MESYRCQFFYVQPLEFLAILMIQLNYKPFIWTVGVITIGIYLVINKWCHTSLASDISKTITVIGIIFLIYTKWLWKTKPLIYILPFPYLGGKWEGELQSTYKNSTTINIHVSIKHGIFNTHLILTTEESRSVSNGFSFNIDSQRGVNQIIYTYHNEPKATERCHSEIHYGTAKLDILENGTILEGSYWTDRQTTGVIKIKKVN